jgi:hypothetical protein
MNATKITAPVAKALAAVAADEVTYYYRSAPKIKGTRLVQAKSSEWLNKKIAGGITSAMLAKLFAAGLVTDGRGKYGLYSVKLTDAGREALGA